MPYVDNKANYNHHKCNPEGENISFRKNCYQCFIYVTTKKQTESTDMTLELVGKICIFLLIQNMSGCIYYLNDTLYTLYSF